MLPPRGTASRRCATADFDETLAAEAKRGNDLVPSCEFSGIKVAYLGTQPQLRVILEVCNGQPGGKPEPDATRPFAARIRIVATRNFSTLRSFPGESAHLILWRRG